MSQNINLYDPSLRTRRDWATADVAVAAVVVCGLVVGLATSWARHELEAVRARAAETTEALQAAQVELADSTQRMAEARPDASLQAELRLAQTTLAQRNAALEMLRAGDLGNEAGHAAALSAFARQTVSGLWLTGIVLDNQQVALRGRALNPNLIPAYVQRLTQESALRGRSFRALDIARPPIESAASAPVLAAPYVDFSLVSAQGAEVAAPAARGNNP